MPLPARCCACCGQTGRTHDGLLAYAAAVVCLLSVVRCAARQHCGLRSLLGGAVCGLGVLALLGLLEPITGISLPLNRFTAFCAGYWACPA